MEINQANQVGGIPDLNKAIDVCLLASGQHSTVRHDRELKENARILKPNKILGEKFQGILLSSF